MDITIMKTIWIALANFFIYYYKPKADNPIWDNDDLIIFYSHVYCCFALFLSFICILTFTYPSLINKSLSIDHSRFHIDIFTCTNHKPFYEFLWSLYISTLWEFPWRNLFFNFLFLNQIFQLFTAFYLLFPLLSLLFKQISDGRRLCVPQRYENRSIWFLCKRFTQKYAMDIIQSHSITFSSSQAQLHSSGKWEIAEMAKNARELG